MRTSSLSPPLALALTLSLATTSLADDFYIDSINGDDSTGTGSVSAPWRTVTHALATVVDPPAGSVQTLTLAPGRYDASSGELYPLVMRDAFELVSASGPERTILDGGQASQVIQIGGYLVGVGSSTLLRGLTITGEFTGIGISASGGVGSSPVFEELVVRGCFIGIALGAVDLSGIDLSLERVRIVENQTGLSASASDGSVNIQARDCDISYNAAAGLALGSNGGSNGSSAGCQLSDCRLVGNYWGLYLNAGGNASAGLLATRTRLCANAVGVRLPNIAASEFEPFFNARLEYCTLSDNTIAGVEARSPMSSTPRELDAHGCILFGNGLDVDASASSPSVRADWSNVGSGSFADAGNNLSVAPLFAGLLPGDWQLAPASPCIDAGDPADGTDADGTPRDLGAHPFDPQHLAGSARFCLSTANSTGAEAVMDPGGSTLHPLNDLELGVNGCPPAVNGIFLFGPGAAQLPFLDGFDCIGGTQRRLPPQATDQAGNARRALDTSATGSWPSLLTPGSTWHFQFLYRDPQSAGSRANLSDGLRVRFEL